MKRILIIVGLCLVMCATAFAQVTFKPTKAILTDSQGTNESSNFNFPSMKVEDKETYVVAYFNGETIKMYSDKNSPDTYISSQSGNGISMKFVAYRSSNTKKIYLVVFTTIRGKERVSVHFKP